MAYQAVDNGYPQKPQQQQPQQQQPQQQYQQQQPYVAQAQPNGYGPGTAYQIPVNEWTHGLFQCFDDMEECCDTYWCTWCKIGWMAGRLDRGMPQMDGLWCCGTCCADYCFAGLGTVAATYMLRSRLLTRYGIKEGGCETVLISLCCCGCALCQQAREMEAKRESCGGTVCKSVPPDQQMPMGQQQPVAGQPYVAQGQPQQQYQQQPQQQYQQQPQQQYQQQPQQQPQQQGYAKAQY